MMSTRLPLKYNKLIKLGFQIKLTDTYEKRNMAKSLILAFKTVGSFSRAKSSSWFITEIKGVNKISHNMNDYVCELLGTSTYWRYTCKTCHLIHWKRWVWHFRNWQQLQQTDQGLVLENQVTSCPCYAVIEMLKIIQFLGLHTYVGTWETEQNIYDIGFLTH
jgi:hypothetical protein